MPSSSKTFTCNSVHIHYSCGCSKKAKIVTGPNNTVNIPVTIPCNTCTNGKATELIIGNTSTQVTGCPHPECTDCREVTACLPRTQFLRLLSS